MLYLSKSNSKIQKEYENKLRKNLETLLTQKPWNAEDILSLKNYLYPINNYISYLMGEAFLGQLGITTNQFQYSDMNKNGYDMEFKHNDKWIVAEIKGNIPCGKNNKYGSQQKKGIEKDIVYLQNRNAKTKTKISENDFNNAYKFLILLSSNETAIKNLIEKNKEEFNLVNDDKFANCHALEDFDQEKINVVLLNL